MRCRVSPRPCSRSDRSVSDGGSSKAAPSAGALKGTIEELASIKIQLTKYPPAFSSMMPASRQCDSSRTPVSQQADRQFRSLPKPFWTGSGRTALPQSGVLSSFMVTANRNPRLPASQAIGRQFNLFRNQRIGENRSASIRRRRRRIETHGACFTAIGRRFNLCRNQGIGENRSASNPAKETADRNPWCLLHGNRTPVQPLFRNHRDRWRTAPPQSGQRADGPKPALAEFQRHPRGAPA